MDVCFLGESATKSNSNSRREPRLKFVPHLILAGVMVLAPTTVSAQEAQSSDDPQDIVVTATKGARPDQLQRVGIAMSAFNEEALADKHFRNLQDISLNIPNAKIDSIGSFPGYATLSFRGFTTTTSIPSIDPAVGIFVDGNYIAVAAGAITDSFDVAGVEVLRGPQGVLFGRNVTGGALLMTTKSPKDELGAEFKASAEIGTSGRGLVTTVAGAVTGPLIPTLLNARLSGFYKHDDGYFPSLAPNMDSTLGRSRAWGIRAGFELMPTDDLDFLLKVDHSRNRGDGAINQQRAQIAQGFASVQADPGISNIDNTNVNLTTTKSTDFGDGVITNILAYRRVKYQARTDVTGVQSDIFPFRPGGSYLFATDEFTRQWQISNELRYAGEFFDGRLKTTNGVYFLKNQVFYINSSFVRQNEANGGGEQDQITGGVFTSNDVLIFSNLTFNLGLRYTYEKKEVKVAIVNAMRRCSIQSVSCSAYDDETEDSWRSWSPKAGLTWQVTPKAMVYGYWARAQRSGGFNLRTTTPAFFSFGPETNSTVEIGAKLRAFDNRVRFNIALFRSKWKDIQETESQLTQAGPVTFFANGADAIMKGVEADMTATISPALSVNASVGYLDSHYSSVLVDLDGKPGITKSDYQLDLPFASKWTLNVGGELKYPLSKRLGELRLLLNFAYRSPAAYNVSNSGVLSAINDMTANLTWNLPASGFSISVYGKNLFNNVEYSARQPLPNPFAGASLGPRAGESCFCSISKGRIVGLEVSAKF